jgi:hypothetical protein
MRQKEERGGWVVVEKEMVEVEASLLQLCTRVLSPGRLYLRMVVMEEVGEEGVLRKQLCLPNLPCLHRCPLLYAAALLSVPATAVEAADQAQEQGQVVTGVVLAVEEAAEEAALKESVVL